MAVALLDLPYSECEFGDFQLQIRNAQAIITTTSTSSAYFRQPNDTSSAIPHRYNPALSATQPWSVMSYRRIEASDPRRPELTRPLTLPPSWGADELDIYASFLGSISMLSGAAMLTRAPYIAYAGLIFACAHIAHDKPFKSSKTKEASTGGPWMSLM